jgi:ankyrin repeat protein
MADLIKVSPILAREGFWQDIKQLMLVSRVFRSDAELWEIIKDEPGGGERLRTRLMYAAMTGNRSRLIFLLRRGANIEATNQWGWSSLGFAAGHGHLPSLRELCVRGANVNAGPGLTALMWASQNGYVEVVRELCEMGANKDAHVIPFYCTPLLLAVKNAQLEVARELCKQGASMSVRSYPDGQTPLMVACQLGILDMVEVLLKAGSEVNATSLSAGCTPLMFAAHAGFLDIVTHLISHGARKDTKSLNDSQAKDFVVSSPGGEGSTLLAAVTPSK